MAEEVKTTPDAEVKAPEGTVEAEVAKVEPQVQAEHKAETVPLSQYLELKKDLKELKKEISDSKGSEKSKVEVQGLGELASKYPDVNQDFLKDLLSSATNTATKKLEEQFSSIVEKQETEKKQLAFDKAFDNLFDKTLNENPDLPKTIDKGLIKDLAQTPKYRTTPLAEILQKMYPTSSAGKGSSENDMRSAADRVDDVVSFDKITPDQRKAIMADPATRQKYFNYLDKQVG